MTYLVFQVVPPVGPSLLHATFFFDDSVLHDGAEYTECHSHTVVIVAVNACTLLQRLQGLPVDFETVGQFLGLNSELG